MRYQLSTAVLQVEPFIWLVGTLPFQFLSLLGMPKRKFLYSRYEFYLPIFYIRNKRIRSLFKKYLFIFAFYFPTLNWNGYNTCSKLQFAKKLNKERFCAKTAISTFLLNPDNYEGVLRKKVDGNKNKPFGGKRTATEGLLFISISRRFTVRHIRVRRS